MDITETTKIVFTKQDLIKLLPEEYRNKVEHIFYSQMYEILEIEVKE